MKKRLDSLVICSLHLEAGYRNLTNIPGQLSAVVMWSLMIWNAAIYCTRVARNSVMVCLP